MGIDFSGIIVGAAAFVAIGTFHPLVIKAEYHWGVGSWWLFLLAGLGCIAGSLFLHGIVSIVLGVVGFSSLWSIHELSKQHSRVEKGWFPKGPGHTNKNKYEKTFFLKYLQIRHSIDSRHNGEPCHGTKTRHNGHHL